MFTSWRPTVYTHLQTLICGHFSAAEARGWSIVVPQVYIWLILSSILSLIFLCSCLLSLLSTQSNKTENIATYCSWFGALCAPAQSPDSSVFPGNCSAESRAKTHCTANSAPVCAGCVSRELKLIAYSTRKLQSIIISPGKQAGLHHAKKKSTWGFRTRCAHPRELTLANVPFI